MCKIISKGLKLENYQSLIKSLCLDKGNFFANKNICISDIKLKIDSFLKKNEEISSHFFKGNTINCAQLQVVDCKNEEKSETGPALTETAYI